MSKTAIDPAKELATIKYLIRLVQRVTEIRAIADQQKAIAAFDTLYAGIYKAEVWEQFKYIPVVAQEAGELISKLKKDLVLATPVKPSIPVDLSDIVSKIEVECERLHTTKKQEAMARFGKSSQALTESELMDWLQELTEIPNPVLREGIQAIAPAIPQLPITEDNAPLLAKILDLRTQLEFDKGDVVHFYTGKIGKAPNFGSSTELKVLIGLLEVEIGDRAATKDSVLLVPATSNSADPNAEFF
jgi:hypothetical protein